MPIFLWYLKIIHVLKYNISQSLVQKIYKMSFFGDYKISVGFFLFFLPHTIEYLYILKSKRNIITIVTKLNIKRKCKNDYKNV